MIINSINNEKIKNYSKLLEKKYRDLEGLCILPGEHLIEEALKRNLVIEIFSLENNKTGFENVTYVSEKVMRKLTNLKTIPNIVAIAKKSLSNEIKGNVIMLDSIQDPGNLGTIIRSAVAFNIDTIILGNDTVDLYNEKVLRATEGMIYNVNIIKKNLNDVIVNLKEEGYKVLGTKVDGGKDIKDISLKKYAILLGNEGNGVKDNLLNLCDDFIYIKMNNKCESLNVAIASSIIMYELNK